MVRHCLKWQRWGLNVSLLTWLSCSFHVLTAAPELGADGAVQGQLSPCLEAQGSTQSFDPLSRPRKRGHEPARTLLGSHRTLWWPQGVLGLLPEKGPTVRVDPSGLFTAQGKWGRLPVEGGCPGVGLPLIAWWGVLLLISHSPSNLEHKASVWSQGPWQPSRTWKVPTTF